MSKHYNQLLEGRKSEAVKNMQKVFEEEFSSFINKYNKLVNDKNDPALGITKNFYDIFNSLNNVYIDEKVKDFSYKEKYFENNDVLTVIPRNSQIFQTTQELYVKKNKKIDEIYSSGLLKSIKLNNKNVKYNLVIICAGSDSALVKKIFRDQNIVNSYNEVVNLWKTYKKTGKIDMDDVKIRNVFDFHKSQNH